ncbi:nucleotide-diphospho-sugar transferase [Decorospora gaudefroyi]|uniref:Nucleotide-diphospho-sugar transferase n=1 Tax=Decorospora gaudefroyi TaxID=184978 RepID=A0A6A5JW12_9PLEO|nr:nucleotide-diphospho-sugar transferase [Decorospora gaudefroyi]
MLASMAGSKPSWMKSSSPWNIFTSPRWIRLALATVVVVSTCIFLAVETRAFDKIPMPALISHKSEEPKKEPLPVPTPPPYLDANITITDREEKLAYVTFLSGTVDAGDDLEEDKYFQAVRILIWQLVHKAETRTKHDVVVMVTPTVSQARRDRLTKDSAIIHDVEFLHTPNDSWVHAALHRWDDVMTKMRVWEMTQYDRILMLDGDSMLLKSLDGVFDEQAAQLLATKPSNNTNLPPTYLVASNSEVWDSSHSFPPTHGTGLKGAGNMNAGFFILAPSLPAFEYYKELLNTPNSFDPRYPEQNLINYAHRWDGPMPWRELPYTWNLRCPNDNDIANGLVSVHEKWWTQPYIYANAKTKQWLLTRRWEMKGWYDAFEGANLTRV